MLEEQTEAPKLKHAIIAVRHGRRGRPGAVAGAWPSTRAIFNDLFVAMVRAGETGGNLEEVLERVAVQLEKDDNLRRTVQARRWSTRS